MAEIHKRSVITKIVEKNGIDTLVISVDPIVIELNITVNSEGGVNVSSAKAKTVAEEEEKVNWAIPTFGSQKIKFGKTE